jgi:DNA-directed RNA polymerase specialized sigma24 family protein
MPNTDSGSPPHPPRHQRAVARAKGGDKAALDALVARYLPRLASWASAACRCAPSLLDLRWCRNAPARSRARPIEVPAALQGYVRSAVLNRIRDQTRWADRRAGSEEVSTSCPIPAVAPRARDRAELAGRYEPALATLGEEERQLLHLRIELDYDHAEIAEMTGKPSKDAARMAVTRAIGRLAEAMGKDG